MLAAIPGTGQDYAKNMESLGRMFYSGLDRANRPFGRIPMTDGRLLGPILLLGGSLLLLGAEALQPWIAAEAMGLAGFALIAGGMAVAVLGWRRDLADASFHAHTALRHMVAGYGTAGPARRVKIRIRCAR